MEKGSRIYVAGHRGLVGSALVRLLRSRGYGNLLLRSRSELDLCDPLAVRGLFRQERPEYVFLAAARVGGILANATRPADFVRENLLIQTHVIQSAHEFGARKLVFYGSSCLYPRLAEQPLREQALLSGPLEPTNEAYAIAKLAGILMCRAYNQQHATNFITLIPCNLYGPGDNFDLETSHVLPALLRKIHEAKLSGARRVELWGTGQPRREFLFVDELAEASLFLAQRYDSSDPINVGTGRELSIRELAELICQLVGFDGELRFDPSKPDGTPRKLLDVTRLAQLGWAAKMSLREGVRTTYEWFLGTPLARR